MAINFTPSTGTAFITFQTPIYAELAIRSFNATELDGQNIKVDWAMRYRPKERTIFIKHLDKSKEDQIWMEIFSPFGPIEDIVIARSPMTNRSLGYGFIQYSSTTAAQKAISLINGLIIFNRSIGVEKFKDRNEQGRYTNLFVKNFGNNFDEANMREIFSRYGRITRLTVPLNVNNNSKGFGSVEFASHRSARDAVNNCNGMEHNGRKLFVGPALQLQKTDEATVMQSLSDVTLCISNLADNIDTAQLFRIFSLFGGVSNADVMNCKGRYRGIGYVTFLHGENAHCAKDILDGCTLESRNIRIVAQIPPGRPC